MYDKKVISCFLERQLKLFPRTVAHDAQEAQDFLEMCMAVVVDSPKEVWEYFEEAGIDLEGADKKTILEIDEVFPVGDGRYLIVEG